AESDRLLDAENLVLRGEAMRQPDEIADPVPAHEIRPQMQHQRRLDVAAVEPERKLARVEEARRRPERERARAHGEQTMLGAQAQRDDIDERFLTAVRVQ